MAEYIDREEYCEKHCRCSNEYCDKESCPIWKAPAMCGREIDYEVDGVNLGFNHYGVVNFKKPFSAEKQLCLSCAARVCNFVENGAREEEAEHA